MEFKKKLFDDVIEMLDTNPEFFHIFRESKAAKKLKLDKKDPRLQMKGYLII